MEWRACHSIFHVKLTATSTGKLTEAQMPYRVS